jgi:hypothetical protein
MCDYSLHLVASRPARVGDKLISTRFFNSLTRGFAAVEEPNIAVCLLPGTELAFADDVRCEPAVMLFRKRNLGQKLARFRQVRLDRPNEHHDALEFPDGQMVMVTDLVEGQELTVLQLPVSAETPREAEPATRETTSV